MFDLIRKGWERFMGKYQFSGHLIESESQRGIGGLHVVLYDLDPSQQNWNAARALNPTNEYAAPGTRRDSLWQQIPGNRLGSVISNIQGQFYFTFDEKDFSKNDSGTPPDLLLLILAPEESIESSLVSNTPQERLLHYSLDIRIDGGRIEQALIKIPQVKLQKHNVSNFRSDQKDAFVASSFKEATRARISYNSSFVEQKKILAKASLQHLGRAKQAFSRFSLSGRSNSSPNFFTPGGNLAEMRDRLADVRLELIPDLDRNANRRTRLWVTQEELDSLGLAVDGSGRVSGSAPLSELLVRLRSRSTGSIEDQGYLLRKYCEKANASEEFDNISQHCAPRGEVEREEGGSDSESGSSGESDVEWTGNVELEKLMSSIRSPDRIRSLEIESPDGEISAVIEDGPSDAVAYHDFQEVQIAFENIWSAAFDETLTPYLRTVYREMVEYQNEVSGEENYPEIESVEDMGNLYREFLEFVDTVEGEEPARSISEPETEPVPARVIEMLPDMTSEIWNHASPAQKANLIEKAQQFHDLKDIDAGDAVFGFLTGGGSVAADQLRADGIRNEAKELMRRVQRSLGSSRTSREGSQGVRPSTSARLAGSRLGQIMREIDERLSSPHRFDIFAPDSVNLGVMYTYRQKWDPESYQVGELISTIPLSPGEVRKYSKKTKIKKSRSEKLIEEQEEKSSSDSSSTQRADSEIVKAAKNQTSFEQTANVTVGVGEVFSGQFGTRFGTSAENSTNSTKKNFREAVLKAAQEFRKSRKLEVTSEFSEAIETMEQGEISNPNDEIAVTYLFYELQRRYQVSEKLHQVTPVIMVANQVPSPAAIDEDWLIKHDWILRRVILDKSFLLALDDVTIGWAGEELALEVYKRNMEEQLRMVEEITRQHEVKTRLSEQAFEELRSLMSLADSADNAQKMQDIGLALAFGPLGLIGSRDDDNAEKREEVVKMAIERADKSKNEVSAQLSREVKALQEAIDKYTSSLRNHFDRQAGISRLRIHIKENILYYMQAIWDHEPTDQRFFRLYNIEVPWVEDRAEDREVTVTGGSMENSDLILSLAGGDGYLLEFEMPFGSEPGGASSYRRGTRRLHEVANLDRLLGYKGNYMLFPAKELSYLHEYMSQDYLNPITGGARDPGRSYAYSQDELADFLCCLRKTQPEVFDSNRERILEIFKNVSSEEEAQSSRLIVPTDSAFIEALPGKHPVMESFKISHRALDVEKAKAELRKNELENLRYGLRLSSGDYAQPSIEKSVLIDGPSDGVVIDTDA